MTPCFAPSLALGSIPSSRGLSYAPRRGAPRKAHSAAQQPHAVLPRLAAATPPGDAAVAAAASAAQSPQILATLSTIVGVFVLAGSFFYKLPQVLRLARRRSGEGLSVSMYLLETVGTSFSALYFTRKAFAFSSYGELVFVVMQNMVILSQIVHFEKHNRVLAVAMAVVYAAVVLFLLSPAAPLKVLMGLQIAAIPILNLARVPQILLNWRRKSTGELSPITLGLQVLGNFARIFTTLASVRDVLMLVGVLVSTAFNSTLVGQWLYYNRRERKTKTT